MTEGRHITDLAYKTSLNELLVTRQGGATRIFNGSDINQLVRTLDDSLTDSINCVEGKGGYYACGSSDGEVILYDDKNNSIIQILCRCTGSVQDISFSGSGSMMAVASDDLRLQLGRVLSENQEQLKSFRSPTALRSVAYDPKDVYIITSGTDGTVSIWQLNTLTDEPVIIHTWKKHFTPLFEGSRRYIIAWHPSGASFAIPWGNGSIRLINRETWTVGVTINHSSNELITKMIWSPNGRYLVTYGSKNKLYVWNMETKDIINTLDLDKPLVTFTWNIYKDELAYVLLGSKKILLWENIIPEHLPNGIKKSAIIRSPTTIESTSAFRPSGASTSTSEAATKTKTAQAAEPPLSMSDFMDDMALNEDEHEADEDDDGNDDDEDGIGEMIDDGTGIEESLMGEETESRADNENLFSDMEDLEGLPDDNRSQPLPHYVRGPVTSLEWPLRFQPGSTTFKQMANATTPEENERRYLDFNLIGLVYTIYKSSHSIINIEFHDQSKNRNFHFSDYCHYTMGALGTSGLVFGVEGQETVQQRPSGRNTGGIDDEDDDDLSNLDDEEKMVRTASMIHYRPANSWSSNKEWTVHLPPNEDVEAVAINDTAVIATTSAGYIRVYTLSGLQIHIFCVQEVVSIVGKADLVLIVCSTAPTFNKQHPALEYILFNTSDSDILQRGPMPVTNEHELCWIGFSETSQPASYDTRGILRVLHRQRRPGQSAWIPVFDGVQVAKARERTEKYWPIGLLHDRLMCIILRGRITEPYFPTPQPSQVELCMPIASTDNRNFELEELYLRKRIITLHERDEAEATDSAESYENEINEADMEMDKALLQLIHLACSTEKLNRANDLVNALHLSKSVDAAIQIATRFRLPSLADKFTEIKENNFLDQNRLNMAHSTTLHEFKESQVSLFQSSVPSMSSDLAFVDRESRSIDTDSLLLNSRKRPMPSGSITEDEPSFEVSDMDMDTTMTSPLPKRSR